MGEQAAKQSLRVSHRDRTALRPPETCRVLRQIVASWGEQGGRPYIPLDCASLFRSMNKRPLNSSDVNTSTEAASDYLLSRNPRVERCHKRSRCNEPNRSRGRTPPRTSRRRRSQGGQLVRSEPSRALCGIRSLANIESANIVLQILLFGNSD